MNNKYTLIIAILALSNAICIHAEVRYSTGAVGDYTACGSSNIQLSILEGRDFQSWYDLAGIPRISAWENGDVWGSDFRDSSGLNDNDLEPQGGSDLPEVYYYSGHGSCQAPPTASDGDFFSVCGNLGKPDRVEIGTSSLWGNNGGSLRFILIDASCPMDLVSLANQWVPPFLQGLHVATGHSGDRTHDNQDNEDRGNQFAAYTVGGGGYPELSVGDAWMRTGLIGNGSQVCAVALAAGATEEEAFDRLANERIREDRSDPSAVNVIAYEWICND